MDDRVTQAVVVGYDEAVNRGRQFQAADALLAAADACPDGDPWSLTNSALQALHEAADAYRKARAGNDGPPVDSPVECPEVERVEREPLATALLSPRSVRPSVLSNDNGNQKPVTEPRTGDQGDAEELVVVGSFAYQVAEFLPMDAPPWAYAAQAYLRAGKSVADTLAYLGGSKTESDLVRWVLR